MYLDVCMTFICERRGRGPSFFDADRNLKLEGRKKDPTRPIPTRRLGSTLSVQWLSRPSRTRAFEPNQEGPDAPERVERAFCHHDYHNHKILFQSLSRGSPLNQGVVCLGPGSETS